MLEHLKRHAIKADALFFVPALIVTIAGAGLMIRDIARWEGEADLAEALNPVGFLLVALGLVIVLVAAFTLRRNYSSSLVIREGHELVVRGIYRLVRHPIYLGATLVMLGMPIALSSWMGLLPMLLLIPLFTYRMRIEERLLLEEFGDDYRSYMARTKKLVPYLY